MARILGLKRPRPMPEVQAQIAALGEELSLTAAFVTIARRGGNEHAALAVIDEQRNRLARSEAVMLKELSKPRMRKVQAAVAGIAAVMLLGSASFAGYRTLRQAPANERIIHSASAKLAAAASTTDATQAIALVDQAHTQLKSLAPDALAEPGMQEGIQDLLQQELQILNLAGAQATPLAKQIQSLAKKVNAQLPKQDPKKSSPPPPPSPDQSAPAAPPAP